MPRKALSSRTKRIHQLFREELRTFAKTMSGTVPAARLMDIPLETFDGWIRKKRVLPGLRKISELRELMKKQRGLLCAEQMISHDGNQSMRISWNIEGRVDTRVDLVIEGEGFSFKTKVSRAEAGKIITLIDECQSQ